MNANEIIVGKDYIIKVGHNEVKVKVLNHTGHSWIVKTVGGKIMPIQMADRFVRPLNVEPESVAPAGEVSLQAPATPAEANGTEASALPTDAVTAVTKATTPPEPATVPSPAVPTELAPVPPAAPVTPVPATAEKKFSMLDAAAQVLQTAGHPMKIQEILDAMQTAGIWTPGRGLTPDRTLIASIGIEQRRKPNPRFRKTAPGTFEYIGGERHE